MDMDPTCLYQRQGIHHITFWPGRVSQQTTLQLPDNARTYLSVGNCQNVCWFVSTQFVFISALQDLGTNFRGVTYLFILLHFIGNCKLVLGCVIGICMAFLWMFQSFGCTQ